MAVTEVMVLAAWEDMAVTVLATAGEAPGSAVPAMAAFREQEVVVQA